MPRHCPVRRPRRAAIGHGRSEGMDKRMRFCATGYDEYWTWGIGHFVAMEVHDEGDYEVPLEISDVEAMLGTESRLGAFVGKC